MPTYTAVTIDRMLEPISLSKKPPIGMVDSGKGKTLRDREVSRPKMSPLLYTTPEPTPLPDSPLSFPPSPYIVNHKRRGPNLGKNVSRSDVSLGKLGSEEEKSSSGVEVCSSSKVEVEGDRCEEGEVICLHDEVSGGLSLDNGICASNGEVLSIVVNSERDDVCEDFFDRRESMSVSSNVDLEDNNGGDLLLRPSTPMGEFFDACEELSNGGGPQASLHDIEAELHEIRLNLLIEIERRKQAEEALDRIQTQWEKLRQQLSLVGLTLPVAPTIADEDEKIDSDPAEELCRQVHLARLVSTSVARGAAKAEIEMEMEFQIESKNFEVTRLWDRLNYYEAVNREMSQRNQEAVDVARRDRQRRKEKQKWVWSSIGVVITLGSAALAWSYLPTSPPLPDCESPTQT
ncbi:hypothetical protein GIB67_027983 [Kingdonia uniflora]|uniref:Uncharacterized protein n=1 Tax=Kingdonia uniflora TaxID=39325 RepID=A0A7J7NVF7_9MAGN|nr:hypothetical protein GIB67_027983 [Kingdonia uniflora]